MEQMTGRDHGGEHIGRIASTFPRTITIRPIHWPRYWLEKRRLWSCWHTEQQRCELVEILTPVIPGMVPSGLVVGRRDAVTSEQMTRIPGILMRQPVILTDRDPQKACLLGD